MKRELGGMYKEGVSVRLKVTGGGGESLAFMLLAREEREERKREKEKKRRRVRERSKERTRKSRRDTQEDGQKELFGYMAENLKMMILLQQNKKRQSSYTSSLRPHTQVA